MFFQNFTLIEGRLTAKPAVTTTPSGKKVSSFSICYNFVRKLAAPAADGKEWESVPNFFNVTAWSGAAEAAAKLDKGDPVSITGFLKYETWTDQTGKKMTAVKIVANSIKSINIESHKKEPEATEIESTAAVPDSSIQPPIGVDEDTIPF